MPQQIPPVSSRQTSWVSRLAYTFVAAGCRSFSALDSIKLLEAAMMRVVSGVGMEIVPVSSCALPFVVRGDPQMSIEGKKVRTGGSFRLLYDALFALN